jgi:hypothetical protein
MKEGSAMRFISQHVTNRFGRGGNPGGQPSDYVYQAATIAAALLLLLTAAAI